MVHFTVGHLPHGLFVQVITEEAAVPFAIITGQETENSDYKGISLDLIKVRHPAGQAFSKFSKLCAPTNTTTVDGLSSGYQQASYRRTHQSTRYCANEGAA